MNTMVYMFQSEGTVGGGVGRHESHVLNDGTQKAGEGSVVKLVFDSLAVFFHTSVPFLHRCEISQIFGGLLTSWERIEPAR